MKVGDSVIYIGPDRLPHLGSNYKSGTVVTIYQDLGPNFIERYIVVGPNSGHGVMTRAAWLTTDGMTKHSGAIA